MRMLYLNSWGETPHPIRFPGCIGVRVVSACTPGEQSHIHKSLSKIYLIKDIFKHHRRLLKRSYWYLQTIGPKRIFVKVRSNVLEYQNKLQETMSAVAGVVIDSDDHNALGINSRIAGYRIGYPLYTDFMLLHPDQITEVPDDISLEDAATVVYYALASETNLHIQNNNLLHKMPIIICGDSLPCRFLNQLFKESNIITEHITGHHKKTVPYVESFVRKGGIAVIGNQQWFQLLMGKLPITQTYFVGLNADFLQPGEWREIEHRWIGLPHSSLYNLNLFSRIPLELPKFLCKSGLHTALDDMKKHKWRPSSFLLRYDCDEAKEGKKLLLKNAYSLQGSKGHSIKNSVIRRKKNNSDYNKMYLRVGLVGLGLWARGNLNSFLFKHKSRDKRVQLIMGADIDPIRLQQATDLFDIPFICSDPAELCRSDEVDAVFISAWHDTHAEIASIALDADKRVFVEKPPVVNYDQLHKLVNSIRRNKKAFLAVGYNRPHSSLTKIIQPEIAKEKGPITFTAIVREPTIPQTHYYYWPHQGSRIVGNACHWIDYAYYLLSPRIPNDIQVIPASSEDAQDNNVIVMRYEDGSLVSLTFTNRGESLIGGHEYIDIKLSNMQYMIHDFNSCTRYKEGRLERIWGSKADRGWEQEMRDVVDGMFSSKPPRDYRDIFISAILMLEAKISYENNGQVRAISSELIKNFI